MVSKRKLKKIQYVARDMQCETDKGEGCVSNEFDRIPNCFDLTLILAEAVKFGTSAMLELFRWLKYFAAFASRQPAGSQDLSGVLADSTPDRTIRTIRILYGLYG